jgi:hypothetical protein
MYYFGNKKLSYLCRYGFCWLFQWVNNLGAPGAGVSIIDVLCPPPLSPANYQSLSSQQKFCFIDDVIPLYEFGKCDVQFQKFCL